MVVLDWKINLESICDGWLIHFIHNTCYNIFYCNRSLQIISFLLTILYTASFYSMKTEFNSMKTEFYFVKTEFYFMKMEFKGFTCRFYILQTDSTQIVVWHCLSKQYKNQRLSVQDVSRSMGKKMPKDKFLTFSKTNLIYWPTTATFSL